MNRYVKLVHYELHRFRKIFFSLLLVTLVSQFVGVYIFSRTYMNQVTDMILTQSISTTEYAVRFGTTSFSRYCDSSLWFLGPIALGVAALLIYMFLIWYRDWFGKNMFIYRLMMLPTSRNNIYLAKLSVILLTVLGLIAFQLLILPLQNAAFNALIPSELRETLVVAEIIAGQPLLVILTPQTFTEFVIYYAAGLMAVIVVFTAIVIERSYRLKGVVGGILYGAAAVVVFSLPFIVWGSSVQQYLYPIELFMLEAVLAVVISCLSLWLSSYLLNKKVTV